MRSLACLALLVACSTNADETPNHESTAGGEDDDVRPPMVLRTTTPVPVPAPDVAREAMSEPMQRLWTGVEEVVWADRPEPPEQGTTDALNEWARGPFREWVTHRTEASRAVESVAAEVRAHGVPFEDIVGGALFGYMYEDMAAGARGAPVPNEVADDPELLPEVGSAVVTAGESSYPADIPIGTVARVERSADEASMRVEVELSTTPDDMHFVSVLLVEPPEEFPLGEVVPSSIAGLGIDPSLLEPESEVDE